MFDEADQAFFERMIESGARELAPHAWKPFDAKTPLSTREDRFKSLWQAHLVLAGVLKAQGIDHLIVFTANRALMDQVRRHTENELRGHATP